VPTWRWLTASVARLEPEFSVTIKPTTRLLFQFSALSFNSHAIHLDQRYCREVEGYRDLLVHGPLSLILMLSVLHSQLQPMTERISNISYRNLAPLYVNEPMQVCVKQSSQQGTAEGVKKWDVWIEGEDGGLRVKGTAISSVQQEPRG
jgi:hydroxyacyl-ACP dehydratase HTD2-like protein with hotdog domain